MHTIDNNVGIFVLLKLVNKADIIVSQIYFDSKYHIKFLSKNIQLVTIANLFLFVVEHRYQQCQLCVLRENSSWIHQRGDK